jgi:Domain of unknown function (DUF4386)
LSSTRRTALIAGIFFALTFIASIPAVLLYDPVLNDADFIVGGGADTRVSLGAFFEVILVIANIGTAIVLFPILKRQNEAVALGYVAARIVESTIIAVGIISLLSIVTLRQDLAGEAGTDSDSLITAGESLVAFHDWTFLLGPGFCVGVGNGLLLGYLMYTSGLVPRRMALLGLIGGPLLFVSSTAVLFGAFEQLSPWAFLLTVPEIAWELSLTIWLIAKGFRPSPILSGNAIPVLQTCR